MKHSVILGNTDVGQQQPKVLLLNVLVAQHLCCSTSLLPNIFVAQHFCCPMSCVRTSFLANALLLKVLLPNFFVAEILNLTLGFVAPLAMSYKLLTPTYRLVTLLTLLTLHALFGHLLELNQDQTLFWLDAYTWDVDCYLPFKVVPTASQTEILLRLKS